MAERTQNVSMNDTFMFCQAGRQKRRCSDIKITTSVRNRRAGRGKRGEGRKRPGAATPVTARNAAARTIGQRGCLREITGSAGKREAGIRRAAGRKPAARLSPPRPAAINVMPRLRRGRRAFPPAAKKTPARKPAFACGNRAGRIGTSPLAVFQSHREGTGRESAAGRLPARRITPAAPSSPLPSACAASEKERLLPSDSSAE